MYKGKRILGFIPARGGSKGLPGKNIRPTAGKPLIAWTIAAARASRYLDYVLVSTDDARIGRVARDHGAEVPFLRPKALAADDSPTIDAIRHGVNFLKDQGQHFDYIALLEPTSPLRRPTDVDQAIVQLASHATADSLVSVGEVHMEHPLIVKRISRGFVVPYVRSRKVIKRRQDLEPSYFPYGVIYLSKIAALLRTGTFYQSRTLPMIIERWQNYEIDDVWDSVCVEAIIREQKGMCL